MRDLQILILDNTGSQLGELELTDSDDFALKLTKSLASINNIGKRNTSFSLDFEVPQTKNNNRLLSGLRFATASKEILGQKECSIVVDGNQIDKGFLYPFESTLEGMYKLNFKGLNNDWVEKLRDVELNQLNWRDYKTGLRTEDATESYSNNRFITLNGQNSVNADLVYPYINRNNAWYSIDFRPQLHLRSIVLSMFEKIGYTVSSAFLESDWIKGGTGVQYLDAYSHLYTHFGLSVDPAFQMTRDPQDLVGQTVDYTSQGLNSLLPDSWPVNQMMGNVSTNYPTTTTIRKFYRWPNLVNTIVSDQFLRFNVPTSELIVGISGTYSLEFLFNYEWGAWDGVPVNSFKPFPPKIVTNNGGVDDYSQISTVKRPPNFKWYVVKNNTSDVVIDGTILYNVTIGVGQRNVHFLNKLHTFSGGDRISVFLELLDDASGFTAVNELILNKPSLDKWRLRISNNSELKITPVANVTLNSVFRINSHIPKGIKCLTLLQDFKTMFNLYFDVDVNKKIVFIEPRDDFYSNIALDITNKIDLNKPPTLNYLTGYKNELVFKYAVDPKDKYLEQYNKINDLTYGELTYVMGNNTRFEKGQSTLSTQLLSATIQGGLNGATTNIISSIVKEEYLDADNVNKPTNQNYGARVFQLAKGRQYDPAGNVRRPSGSTLSTIVLTGIMENFANTPTYQDRRLTFNATNGLVEEFYSKTLANIEDTAILTLKIVLSLYEFQAWDLRRPYYISEPAEIAGYYITDSIKNFNVTKETPTTVTLVKFKDFTPVVVPQGVGNVPVIVNPPPQPQEIFVTVNGAIVPCLDNNLQKMYRK